MTCRAQRSEHLFCHANAVDDEASVESVAGLLGVTQSGNPELNDSGAQVDIGSMLESLATEALDKSTEHEGRFAHHSSGNADLELGPHPVLDPLGRDDGTGRQAGSAPIAQATRARARPSHHLQAPALVGNRLKTMDYPVDAHEQRASLAGRSISIFMFPVRVGVARIFKVETTSRYIHEEVVCPRRPHLLVAQFESHGWIRGLGWVASVSTALHLFRVS